ncbi:TPA: glucosyltransferase domain-containing protein [Enterobacter hormaechei]
MNRFENWVKDNKPGVILSFIMCLLFVSPIILVGHIYIDDHTRTTRLFLWSQDARYGVNFIYNLLSMGNGQLDYFPFTNMAGTILIGVGAVIICIVFDVNGTGKIALISSAMLLSPFLPSNLTYRFDSLTMGLSVVTAILPYLFIGKARLFSIISLAFLVITGILYQSSMAMYLCIGIAYCAINYCNFSKLTKSTLTICILFLASSMIIIVISRAVGGIDRTDLVTTSNDVLGSLLHNLLGMWKLIKSSAHGVTLFAYCLSLTAFLFGCFFSLKRGFSYFVVQIIAFLLILLTTVILNVVLLSPWFNSRTMIAFPAVIVFCFLVLIKNHKVNTHLQCLLSAFMFGSSLLFVSVFANSLSAQDRINNVYLSKILSVADTNTTKIAIYGRQPVSREFLRAFSVYPLLENLVPNYMVQGSGWAQAYIGMMTSRFQMISMKEQESILKKSCEVKKWNMQHMFYYKIYNEYLIVSFNGDNC